MTKTPTKGLRDCPHLKTPAPDSPWQPPDSVSFPLPCLCVFLPHPILPFLKRFTHYVYNVLSALCQHHQKAPDLATDGCEPPCGCWELNSEPLEGLLASEAARSYSDLQSTHLARVGLPLPDAGGWGAGGSERQLPRRCAAGSSVSKSLQAPR